MVVFHHQAADNDRQAETYIVSVFKAQHWRIVLKTEGEALEQEAVRGPCRRVRGGQRDAGEAEISRWPGGDWQSSATNEN